MAAGDRLLDASGNVILDSSGNVQLSDGVGDDCCCEAPSGCDACSPTPRTWTVTVSGVAICSGCLDLGGTGLRVNGGVNGTYTLSQLSNCLWGTTIAGCTYTLYTDNTCTTVSATVDVEIRLAHASANTTRVTIANAGGGTTFIFDGTNTSSPCPGSSTITNGITSSCTGFGPPGTGGSASVSS